MNSIIIFFLTFLSVYSFIRVILLSILVKKHLKITEDLIKTTKIQHDLTTETLEKLSNILK